jgi:hypothetical protein
VHARYRSVPAFLSLLSISGLVFAAGSQAAASTTAASDTAIAPPSAVAAMQTAWSSVPEYSSSPMIDQGTVLDSAGQPVSGATVILFPVLIAPPAGTVMTPLASATTDASGHYAIHLPAASDSELANSESAGALNLHVMAFYPGGQANWYTPIPAGAAGVAPATTLTLAATGTPAAGQPVTPSASSSASPSPSPAGTAAPEVCVDQTPTILSGFSVTVGYSSSLDTNLAFSAFSYGGGATNVLGAAVSVTSGGQGYSVSGTTSESDASTTTFPHIVGKSTNNLNADGAYVKQEVVCGPIVTKQWTVTQDAVGGAFSTPGEEPLSAGDCFSGPAGGSEKFDKTLQTDFSQGVQIGGHGIDINLSSQVGYSSSAELIYMFGNLSAPYCGVHNFPGATQGAPAGHIVVHAAT